MNIFYNCKIIIVRNLLSISTILFCLVCSSCAGPSTFKITPPGTSQSGGSSGGSSSNSGSLPTDPNQPQNLKQECLNEHTPTPTGTTEQITMEEEIALLTNQYRAEGGPQYKALVFSSVISTIARGHAKNMAAGVLPLGHDYFSERMGAVSCHGFSGYNGAGENAAQGGSSAEEFVRMWRNSPGHAQNMRGNYIHIGVGVYGSFAVQLFF